MLDSTVAVVLTADAECGSGLAHISATRRRQKQLSTELDRMLAAIRAGMDPRLAAGETRKIQAELAVATETIRDWELSDEPTRSLTEAQVREVIGSASALIQVLEEADRTDRAELYDRWAYGSAIREKLQPGGNWSTPDCS